MAEKAKLTPCTCFSHDEATGRLKIDLEMPGADKKEMRLDMRKDSFCVSAPKGEDAEYSSCFKLSHDVEPEKAEAKYENGLLRIFAPIKDWDKKHRVRIG